MTKDELLAIQFKLNSQFAGSDDQATYKALNQLNSSIRHFQDEIEKKRFDQLLELDQIKVERENLNPMQTEVIAMYDLVIDAFENNFFQ